MLTVCIYIYIYIFVIMSMCACGYIRIDSRFRRPSYQMYLTLGRSPISVPSSTTAGSSVLPLARRRCRCCRCPSSRSSKEDSPCSNNGKVNEGEGIPSDSSLGHLALAELSFRFSSSMNSFKALTKGNLLCQTSKTCCYLTSQALELWNNSPLYKFPPVQKQKKTSEKFQTQFFGKKKFSDPHHPPAFIIKGWKSKVLSREWPIRPTFHVLQGFHPSGDLGTEGAEDSTPAYSSIAPRSWWNWDQMTKDLCFKGWNF